MPTFFVLRQASASPTLAAAALNPELRAELAAVATSCGCELLHVEWKGGVLRLFLDRLQGAQGVTLADCEGVSRRVSALLDVAGWGGGRYTLEVSSPGLDRELYSPRDYERFAGCLVRVTFDDWASGKKRTVVGRLAEYRSGSAEITVVERDRGESLLIPLARVRLAKLELEL